MKNPEKESYRPTSSNEEKPDNLTASIGPVKIQSNIDQPLIDWIDNKLNGKKK